MNKKAIKKWIENPWRIVNSLSRYGFLNWVPDNVYISLMYRATFSKKIDLKNPKTFSEKLQWLKLNDRKDKYTTMVDKYEAKQFVASCIGNEYVVPVIGGPWDSVEEIDFAKLPDQFVLKTTHDCGGVVICKDKQFFDKESAIKTLQEHLERNYYLHCREWPYKNVKPRIFAEKYLLSDTKKTDLQDYKFFTFNGEPKLMYIASGRDYAIKDKQVIYADFFDMDFNHVDLCIDHENAPVTPSKPENFELMISCARKLSQGTKHLRVDFYEVDGHLYTGELTFFHCGGFRKFITEKWDLILGDWISIK